ncbi:MAG: DNA polymerase III subunit delta [Planctomycetes bacterium]|nr:DNA polymerase III subunit delta [Planctomycetota bacterium]
MAATKAKAKIEEHPIYVIAGKDNSLVNSQCDKLLDQIIAPEQRQMCLFNPDAGQVSISQVLDELRTLPFLTDKRVVLIRSADKFITEHRTMLENYFDNPCATGVLILTANSFPSNTKLAKKLTKVGKLISIVEAKGRELPVRIIEYAHDAYDKRLNNNAAGLLIELTGDNLGQLYAEIDKLALFAGSEKDITTGHIESLIGHNRLFSAFNVIDAALAGNVTAAVERLRRMFEADKSTEYTFIGAFAYHFKRMFNAKALLDKGRSPYQVASELGIWGNKDALFNQLRKVSLKQIGRQIEHLAEIDYAIKTGQSKPKTAAEQLVYKLVAI